MANSIELSNWSQEHSNHGSSTQGPGSIAMPDHTVAQIYFQGGIELGLDPGDKIDLQVDGSSIYSISRTGDDQWIEDVANDVTKNATSGGTLYFTLPHTAGAMNVQVVATCEPTDTWKIQEISVLSKNSDALVELNANAYEGGQPGSFRFTRTGDGDISKAVNIRYTVEPVDPDPAVEGLDFERLTGSVTILAGQETALVPVEAVDDIDFEYPQTFKVRVLEGPSYDKHLDWHTATMTIYDNDGGPGEWDPPEWWPPYPAGSGGGKNAGGGTDGPYGGGGGDDGNPNDTVTTTVGGGGSSIGTTDGGDGETAGAFIPVNDDNDEQNSDSTGLPLPDNQPNAVNPAGHRIVAGDSELRDWSISVSSDATDRGGTLTVTWNDRSRIKVWKPESGGQFAELSSGDSFPVNGAFSTALTIEGVEASETLDDIQLASVFTPTSGREVTATLTMTAISVDLDIDSDNNDGLSVPARTNGEDRIEHIANDANVPGKLIAVNDGDANQNNIPDSVDYPFGGKPGERYTPIRIELPTAVDLSSATIRFIYSGSDPGYISATEHPDGSFTFTPAPGKLRLWRRSPSEGELGWLAIEQSAGSEVGDYVPPNYSIDADVLFVNGSRTSTLYLEGIAPSAAVADQRIEVQIDPDGTGSTPYISTDAVTATVLKFLEIQRLSAPTTNDAEDHWSAPVNGSVSATFRVHLHSLGSGGYAFPADEVVAQTYTIDLGTAGTISQVTDSAGHAWTIDGSTASLSLDEPLVSTSFDVTVTFGFSAPGMHDVTFEGTASIGTDPGLMSRSSKKTSGGRAIAPAPAPGAQVTPTEIYHILDPNGAGGAGHSAVIIPNVNGCTYYSYSADGSVVTMNYNNINDALAQAKAADYTHYQKWNGVDAQEAASARDAAMSFNQTDYNVNLRNCWNMVFEALEAAGTDAQDFGSIPNRNYDGNATSTADESGLIP